MTSELELRAEELRTRGYTVIHGVLDPELIAAANQALDEIFAREASIADERTWKNEVYRVAYMLPQKHEVFRQFPLNPRVLTLMRMLLGDDCVCSSLNGLTMASGGITQKLHKDTRTLPGNVCYINALQTLDDFTIANGCTRLVPGSQDTDGRGHNYDHLEEKAIYVEAPAGSLIAYNGATVHAGSKNTTERTRRALHVLYNRPWVKPTWDFSRSLSPEVIKNMTMEQRAIFAVPRRQQWYDWQQDLTRYD